MTSSEIAPEPGPLGEAPRAPRPAPTGHAAVDGATARLADAAELAPAEQVVAYEATHEALRQTLDTIDQS